MVTIDAKHHLHVLSEPNLRGKRAEGEGEARGVCGRGLTVSFSWAMAKAADGVAPDKLKNK